MIEKLRQHFVTSHALPKSSLRVQRSNPEYVQGLWIATAFGLAKTGVSYFFFASVIIIASFLFVTPAYAARFTIELPRDAVAPGSEIITHVFLDTEGESLNAYEGRLVFPADLFDVTGVRDGSSIITVWLNEPESRDAGSVEFSGITPGGYLGARGFLFSVVLRAKAEGVCVLSLSGVQALKNDGNGTAARVSTVESSVSVSRNAPSSALQETPDTTPPESFELQVIQSDEAFDGKRVLIFTTQDKGSGIARYEVCEGLFAACSPTESPYFLKRQSDDVLLKVKAVDNNGNTRTEYLYTSGAVMRYSLYGILAILLGMGALFALIRMRRRHLR